MEQTCGAPECGRDVKTRGVCNKHYMAYRKSGTPFPPFPSTDCPQCGVTFTATQTARQRFCSVRCQKRAHRNSSKRVCSEPDCDRPMQAKGLCGRHYNAQSPNRASWKRNGRPEVRRAGLRRSTQKRRALLRDPNAELIDRDAIGDRDGWLCGLCRKPVDRTLAYPAPMGASLDHIVPLSLGGGHNPANVQIAHLFCNVSKGNRAVDVQPLLVG